MRVVGEGELEQRIAATKTSARGDTSARRKASHKKRCELCRATFTARRSDARFCSQSCRQKAARKSSAKQRRKAKRVDICVQCHEPFVAVGPKKQYCSHACRQEAYRQRQRIIAELVRLSEHQHYSAQAVKEHVRGWSYSRLVAALQRASQA